MPRSGEDDGWNGTSDHPFVRVRAASFEQAKTDIEYALGKHIEQLLHKGNEQYRTRSVRLTLGKMCSVLETGIISTASKCELFFGVGPLRKRRFLRHVLQHVSHFAVYLLMLLPCSVAGIFSGARGLWLCRAVSAKSSQRACCSGDSAELNTSLSVRATRISLASISCSRQLGCGLRPQDGAAWAYCRPWYRLI